MFYQVSMKCGLCGSLFPYSMECEAHLATMLREAREPCPYCGALMSPQVAEIREAKLKPSPVTKPSDSSLYWHFHQVARSQVGM